ncbi:CyP450 monooxygenase [Schizopora paradoxa]|uniref:CyP450 monooxygenase n=1 Tax=Schizopora paradoxa TaxID=27342 RepID=A0A0H2R2F5_9AGAM|nr:CyP450 monooxygenase [Schizopora paradoxa]
MSTYRTILLDACVVCATITLSLLLRRRRNGQHKLPLPPGPRGLPIVGNLFQVPAVDLWEKALDWGKIYGWDMIYLDILGRPMLIINSHQVAVDLLNKRSLNYSSRPQLLIHQLTGWDWITSMVPYGEMLRKQRAILHRFLQSPEVINYKEIQEQGRCVFLQNMLESPGDYCRHIRRLTASVLGLISYGHEVRSDGDRYLELGEKSAENVGQGMNYLYLDFFPWIRHLPSWFPGGSFHKFAEVSRNLSKLYKSEIYSLNKSKRLNGTAKESMTTIFVDENQDSNGHISNEDEEEFMNAAATVFIAGSDTSVAVLMNFVLAMLKFPEVQRLAQDEIDRVVGDDRLPSFEDREQLPYIKALCLEILRHIIRSKISLVLHIYYSKVADYRSIRCFAHTTTEEDVYRGYRIPAGTMVMANAWAISCNEESFPDPLDFKPERWLHRNSETDSLRPDEFAFGYGRRVCPGQVWAEHMIFITVVSLLAAFDIKRALDSNGEPVPLNENHNSAIVRLLGPSKCMITPRSEKMASMIRDCA